MKKAAKARLNDSQPVSEPPIEAARAEVADSPEKVAALEAAFRKVLEWVTQHEPEQAKAYVRRIRARNPDLDNEALARKLMSRASFDAGMAGFLTSLGGAITLPVSVPANLLATWRIQALMVIRMAYLFEAVHAEEELVRDILLVMAGDAGKEALRTAGVAVGRHWTKKAVETLIIKQTMNLIWKVIPRTVITKAGTKSVLSFTKLAPLVGGPIGFAFDWGYAQAVGRRAIAYYRDSL